MARFYSGRGDPGTTDTNGNRRLPKYHPRIETLGAMDEASAALGVARAATKNQSFSQIVKDVQNDLSRMMGVIASVQEGEHEDQSHFTERIAWLETQIERISAGVDFPRGFILPGDIQSSAAFSFARTVVRRAERRVCELRDSGELDDPSIQVYLNRLSTLCFVIELLEIRSSDIKEPTLVKF